MSDEQHPDEKEQSAADETGLAPLVPPSTEHGADGDDRGDNANRGPSREDILHKLDQMPGLIAIGLLPPAKANAMKGVYQTMLSIIAGTAQNGPARVANEDVVKILQEKPELLRFLQAFLSPAQLDLIVREAPK